MSIREHPTPGKSYLLIYEDHFDDPPGPWLMLTAAACRKIPRNRRELEKGIVQNDHLRGPELR